MAAALLGPDMRDTRGDVDRDQTGDSEKKNNKKKQFSMTDAIVEEGKSPFQLFCVCSVILSVNSAFQRSVLGMSMRKNDHQL